jgi:hypothetical protein
MNDRDLGDLQMTYLKFLDLRRSWQEKGILVDRDSYRQCVLYPPFIPISFNFSWQSSGQLQRSHSAVSHMCRVLLFVTFLDISLILSSGFLSLLRAEPRLRQDSDSRRFRTLSIVGLELGIIGESPAGDPRIRTFLCRYHGDRSVFPFTQW